MSEFKHLKHTEIDRVKYSTCLEQSANNRIYAEDWYLDIVTNTDWECLVLEDYQAVLPLPFARIKKRWFARRIAMPRHCQQLGWFYPNEFKKNTVHLSLEFMKSIGLSSYSWNRECSLFLPTDAFIYERVNYELNLNAPHAELQQSYNQNTKRNIRKGAEGLKIQATRKPNYLEIVNFKNEHTLGGYAKKYRKIMTKILAGLAQRNMLRLYEARFNGTLASFVLCAESKGRLYYLLGASSSNAKSYGTAHKLFDFIIQENCERELLLDFEGSDIPGLQQFFEGFGAKKTQYLSYRK